VRVTAAAAGLRPLLVAGPPLDEQLLLLLALLPLPHQASPRSLLAHWCVSAAAARCGMGREGIDRLVARRPGGGRRQGERVMVPGDGGGCCGSGSGGEEEETGAGYL